MTARSILQRTRKSWITRDFAKTYPYLIKKTHESNQMNKRCTLNETKLATILKLLHPLQSGSIGFGVLYQRSQIRMKRSFLNVLDMCVSGEFVTKDERGYTLTMKGYQLLVMFKK